MGSRVRFDQRLRSEGTDLATWQEDLRRALVVQTYMQRRFGKRIVVSRRMMWDYYVGHRGEFRSADAVQMQVIAAPVKHFLSASRSPDRKAARRRANALIDRADAALARGWEFAKVAKTFSKGPMAASGGVWGMMERGSFRAEVVEEVAFAQKAGQVSKVIETPEGFYIVRTLTLRRGAELAFAEVQEKIAEKLRRQQFEGLTAEYLKELYGGITIIGADRFERLAVETAVRKYFKRL